ncbi:hypothetical protein prwr041_07250 [Prevotella herbatica]|uniref:Pectate lyase n=1 Tax=Prevotella herbatica TaxID=2801997 RepID=A0ABM7NWE2_9BACT|nr:hypothetical protein [Prevotella herbatica]BCS84832.1 hypothetical protein prwr041_07250 [Prevotella herbatica]
MKRQLLIITAMAAGLSANAQQIDFNLAGRQASQVTEDGFTPWAIATTRSESMLLQDGGITVKIALDNSATEMTMKSCWWKDGANKFSKLISDGVTVYQLDAKGNTTMIRSGSVKMVVTISGLSAGKHTLLAYHNDTDGNSPAKLDVYTNGIKVQTGVKQSSRATNTDDCGMSYIEFNAEKGKDVTIWYVTTPESGKDYTKDNGTTSLTINALVLDRPNPKTTASTPIPANRDYHVDADNRNIKLEWKAAATAVKHHVRIGTSSDNMHELATVTGAYYQLNNMYNLNEYFWRIDEEDANGNIHEGDLWTFRPRHLAFPGAEGYGKYAIGGRGGSVYHVTTLADNGDDENPISGSFRYGIKKATGPRTIVFDVGGVIALKNRLTCSDKYVTIAGQTAPGNGIMLRDCPFGMAEDGITRFMRMRLGHKTKTNGVIDAQYKAAGLDGMGMAGNNNSIMDHCSIGWTIDEAFSSRNARSITLQRTLISEALNVAGHPNYKAGTAHGYAATIGGGEASGVGSFHHNLLAHDEGRNWSISGGLDGSGAYDGHHDIFNNVVYNWGGRACDGGSHQANFVSNFYKEGPATTQKYLLRAQLEGTGTGSQSYYVNGNLRQEKDGTLTEDKENETYRVEASQVYNWQVFVDKPFFASEATIESAKSAYKDVLSDVGCNMPSLDNHDTRMINETINGTTSTKGSVSGKAGLIDSEEDKGCEGFGGLNVNYATRCSNFDTDGDGMPDWWEKANSLSTTTADNNGDANRDGYTNLEDYLNWIAVPHFTIYKNETSVINLKDFFAGFTNSPTFELSGSNNIIYNFDGANTLTVKSKNNKTGFYTITIKASDKDGWGTMLRVFNFYIDGNTSATRNINNSKRQ